MVSTGTKVLLSLSSIGLGAIMFIGLTISVLTFSKLLNNSNKPEEKQ